MDVNDVVKLLGRVRHKDLIGIGRVKFYDNSSNKQFGYLESEHGDIFFHGSRALEFVPGSEDLPIADAADLNPDGSLSDPPRRNDEVLFISEEGPKGLRARKWVKWDEDEFLGVIGEMDARPYYRFMYRHGHKIQSNLSKGVNDGFFPQWTGRNLDDLRERFNSEVFPLFEFDDEAWYFEVQNQETKEWELVDDPR